MRLVDHRMEIVLDMDNMTTISGIVPNLSKLIKHPKLGEVDVVEGAKMEDEEEDMEKPPMLLLLMSINPLLQI